MANSSSLLVIHVKVHRNCHPERSLREAQARSEGSQRKELSSLLPFSVLSAPSSNFIFLLRRCHYSCNRSRHPLPIFRLFRQLLPPRRRQRIELRPPVI